MERKVRKVLEKLGKQDQSITSMNAVLPVASDVPDELTKLLDNTTFVQILGYLYFMYTTVAVSCDGKVAWDMFVEENMRLLSTVHKDFDFITEFKKNKMEE